MSSVSGGRCSVSARTGETVNRICPRTGRWCELTYCEGCVPNLYPLTQPVRYGWICPRCNQVKSPDENSCYCNSGAGNTMAKGQ